MIVRNVADLSFSSEEEEDESLLDAVGSFRSL